MKFNSHSNTQGFFIVQNQKDIDAQGIEHPMLKDFETRRKTIKSHIKLLENRYPEPVRREAVQALENRLKALVS